jgi:hypothetical protein
MMFLRSWLYPLGLALTGVGFTLLFILFFNPVGLGQVFFFGQRPPYHWVMGPTPSKWDYVGINERSCAHIYLDTFSGGGYRVYGYGFSETYQNINDAMMKAQRECQ